MRLKIYDLLFFPLFYLGALLLKRFRSHGINAFPLTWKMLQKVGVFPILDHYYEPLFQTQKLKSLREDRVLKGINFNEEGQLALLKKFNFNEELVFIKENKLFDFDNPSFKSGDADFLYNMIRYLKPNRIIEIGSGYSTLMAIEAIEKNKLEQPEYKCKHICIEPYEQPWLEELNVEVIREKVEEVDRSLFNILEENDILFIDSSHIIRPQGDVLFEYLELLPSLNVGVYIHIHDIFTPKDYLDSWIKEKILFWNEQYLLEAFLSFNSAFEVVGAVNYLMHHHGGSLLKKCPILAQDKAREPGSFWIKRSKL